MLIRHIIVLFIPLRYPTATSKDKHPRLKKKIIGKYFACALFWLRNWGVYLPLFGNTLIGYIYWPVRFGSDCCWNWALECRLRGQWQYSLKSIATCSLTILDRQCTSRSQYWFLTNCVYPDRCDHDARVVPETWRRSNHVCSAGNGNMNLIATPSVSHYRSFNFF